MALEGGAAEERAAMAWSKLNPCALVSHVLFKVRLPSAPLTPSVALGLPSRSARPPQLMKLMTEHLSLISRDFHRFQPANAGAEPAWRSAWSVGSVIDAGTWREDCRAVTGG